jgi:GAF domain-containing protein
MAEIDAILKELLSATGASRVTLRQDVPGDIFPVTHEALADGAPSILGVPTPDMSRQPVVLEIQEGRQVVQDDCPHASAEPHFREMLELYGGLRAQIVTPVVSDGRVTAIVSVHQLGRTRRWSEVEVEIARRAAERVGELL